MLRAASLSTYIRPSARSAASGPAPSIIPPLRRPHSRRYPTAASAPRRVCSRPTWTWTSTSTSTWAPYRPLPSRPLALPLRPRTRSVARTLSSEGGGGGGGVASEKKGPPSSSGGGADRSAEGGGSGSGSGSGSDDDASREIALTPGQKVVVGSRVFIWSFVFIFALACAYYIGKELMPSKMSPNAVFDGAFDAVRDNEEVRRRFGDQLKAYGRDHGGHREGRRNFVEHTEYTDKDDESRRTRVRFNLEGKFGQAFVFAEVSSDMPSGEFVYVLVQDKRNGRVITVIDNRSALAAKRMAGGSKEGTEALTNLLTGGGKK